MAFSTETRALMALGYGLVSINSRAVTLPDIGTDGLLFVEGILADLAELDLELKANISDSMAEKVEGIGLNYAQYITQTSARGSRLLERLAAAIDTPVAYDSYKNTSKGGSSIAIRNYY